MFRECDEGQRMSRKSFPAKRAGFTMLEVIIGVAILSMVMIYVATCLIGNQRSDIKARQKEIEKMYALDLLEEVARSPYPKDDLPKSEQWQNVLIGDRIYRIERATRILSESSSSSRILVEVTVKRDDDSEMIQLQETVIID